MMPMIYGPAGGGSEVYGEKKDGRVRGDGEAGARPAEASLQARALTERSRSRRTDGAKTEEQGWGGRVCDTQIHP